MKQKKQGRLTILLILISLVFGACGRTAKSGTEESPGEKMVKSTEQEMLTEDPRQEKDLRKLTLILDYVINTNHSGLFLALERGYYEEEGLQLEIIEPQEGVTLQLLASGRADFGVSYQEDLTYALDAEDPLPLRAIAAIIQNNTSGFASLKEKNITGPADFAGKIYAGWGSAAEQAIIEAAVKQAGENPESVEFVTSMDTSYTGLKGDIDFMWLFEGWDIIAAKMAGLDLHFIPCRDIDERLNYYTPILVARNDTIDKDKELVSAFIRATKRGYEEASKEENLEEICDILLRYSPELNPELVRESQKFLAGEYSKGADTWGLMKADVWLGYAEFLQENGLIQNILDAEAYFTNEFLFE